MLRRKNVSLYHVIVSPNHTYHEISQVTIVCINRHSHKLRINYLSLKVLLKKQVGLSRIWFMKHFEFNVFSKPESQQFVWLSCSRVNAWPSSIWWHLAVGIQSPALAQQLIARSAVGSYAVGQWPGRPGYIWNDRQNM